MFGSSSPLPPLVSGDSGMVCELVGKSDHFDSKQSRESADLPLTCLPSPEACYIRVFKAV